MNYELTYHNLINKSKLRGLDKIKLEGYYEKHHIVPKSLGGSDLLENLVLLTAREHFIAHWLLTKFTVGNDRVKMLYALYRMSHGSSKQDKKLTSRQYGICKKANSEAIKLAAEAGTHSGQTLKSRQALSERSKAIAEAGLMWTQSDEGKEFTSSNMIQVNSVKITCEHCGKSTNLGLHSRWHGDKCKLLTEIGSNCLLTDKPTNWQVCPVTGCGHGYRNSKGSMIKHMKKHHS